MTTSIIFFLLWVIVFLICRPMPFCFTHTQAYMHTRIHTYTDTRVHTHANMLDFYVRWENGRRIPPLEWYKQHLPLPLKVPRTNQSTILLKLEDIEFFRLLIEHAWGATLRSVGDPNTAALSGKASSMADGFPIDGAPFYVPSQVLCKSCSIWLSAIREELFTGDW